MSGPLLHVIEGDGDVVGYLEGLLERARQGEFVGALVATLDTEGIIAVGWAMRDDMEAKWSRNVAMAATLHDWLMRGEFDA